MGKLACLIGLLIAVGACAETPTFTRGGGSITVTNGVYTAVVSETNGVLQRLATAAFGDQTLVNGGFTYSDIGLLAEGSHAFFGTSNATDTKVEVKTEGETVILSAEGSLCLPDGKLPPGAKWRYRFRYTFDGTPVLHVVAGVQTDTARPVAPGFFATTMSVGGVNEWFADTEKGMQWVDLGPENGRCFEMHTTPLRPERRRAGLLNHDNGAVVLLDNIRCAPEGTLEDIIFHSGGTGQVTVFLNWLDGQKQTAFEAGEWYDLSWDVSVSGQLPE